MARPKTSRVSKHTSSPASTKRMTRQKSRLNLVGSSRSQTMVAETTNSTKTRGGGNPMEHYGCLSSPKDHVYSPISANMKAQASQSQDKGKGRAIEAEMDRKTQFPIMELPTEIRLEIYRACLTRPYKVLLSKVEKPTSPAETVTEATSDAISDSEIDDQRAWFEVCHRSTRGATRRSTTNFDQVPRRRNRPSRALTSAVAPSSSYTAQGPDHNVSQPLPLPSTSTISLASGVINPDLNPIAARSREPPRPNTGKVKQPIDNRPKSEDPLVVNILRANKEIYKEARSVLYSENIFDLDINTAVNSLAALHQRSRRHIKHIELEIPTYTEILERFSEIVRLSLRYCSGLKKFVIHTPFTLPGADGMAAATNTTVYANGFDILRWLPQECQVILAGNSNPEIDAVVNKHLLLAKTQDKATYVYMQVMPSGGRVIEHKL